MQIEDYRFYLYEKYKTAHILFSKGSERIKQREINMTDLKVHIVEDQVIIAYDLQDIIENMGHQVNNISSSVDEAISKIHMRTSDLFIVDINLQGDKTGFELGKFLEKSKRPFIYMSSVDIADQSERNRACAFLSKPFDKNDVQRAIEIICRKVA